MGVRLSASACLAVLVTVLLATSAPAARAQESPESGGDVGDAPLITDDDLSSHPDRPLHDQRVSGSSDEPLTGEEPPAEPSPSTAESPAREDDGALPLAEEGLLQASVTDPDAPVAMPDAYAVANDQVLSVAAPGFLGNDVDLDGEALQATLIVDAVDHGSLSAFADGRFTYTPAAGFVGTDSFTYRMRDASFNTADATVTIEVLPAANRAPVGTPDGYTMRADTTLSVAAPGFLGNDADPDGEALQATLIVDAVDHGTLSAFADGRFTYTPAAGFVGTDSFTYRMRDASFNTADATVTIEVVEGNRPPIGVDDQYAAVADTALSVAAPGFLGNDVDLDGDALQATLILDDVDHGSLSAFADGRFTYTPDAGFAGTDSFQYRMRDDFFHDSDPVTVTLVVHDPNVPPVAVDDAYDAGEDSPLAVDAPGVLGNDEDANGDPLKVVANTDPANGSVTQSADGSFLYTPDADFCGVDTYDYTVSDDQGATDNATVTITVQCVNDPPVALDDAYTTLQDTVLDVTATDGVLVQGDADFDLDGDPISVDTFDATSAFGGTVSVDPDGAFTYAPAPGFAGSDSFTYTITDGQGGVDTATVTITVEATDNRSIDVELLAFDLVDRDLGGQMLVTNRTSSGAPVQVVDLDVRAEYRRPGDRTWTDAAVTAGSCQFDPTPDFVVTDEQTVGFSGCQLAGPVPDDATVRITGRVRIDGAIKGGGHADGWYESRMSG